LPWRRDRIVGLPHVPGIELSVGLLFDVRIPLSELPWPPEPSSASGSGLSPLLQASEAVRLPRAAAEWKQRRYGAHQRAGRTPATMA